MDILTPITREEMLMNDEPMTPITREEKILAGEDLNPVTRREYFLKKYRHAGGDVMVEGLEVTANGTYTAPEGKAYSPVEVDVPLPENAYLLKTASGSLVSFSDGADLPMPSFVCKIEAVQSGSGDPSPENIRPISGHTGVDAVISPTTEASAGTTYSVSWQTEAGEVFGGYVDLVSGVLTVTHRIENCKNLYFVSGVSSGGLNYADISISVGNTPISNKLKSVEKNIGWASTAFCVSVNNDNKVRVYGRLSDFEDGGTYENTMVRYELATPQTYQLTPTQIKSLRGNNNAWCDTGDVDIDYFAKEVKEFGIQKRTTQIERFYI